MQDRPEEGLFWSSPKRVKDDDGMDLIGRATERRSSPSASDRSTAEPDASSASRIKTSAEAKTPRFSVVRSTIELPAELAD